jgi:hypothetical protein
MGLNAPLLKNPTQRVIKTGLLPWSENLAMFPLKDIKRSFE